MSQKNKNAQAVKSIIDIAKHSFTSEGDANHDALLICHIENTPKGEDEGGMIQFYNGCTCNLGAMLYILAKDDKELYQEIIAAVGAIASYRIRKQNQERDQAAKN
jgi:hypothetical protein